MSDSILIKTIGAMQAQLAALMGTETPRYLAGTWTPTFGGFSADPSGGIYRYILVGKMVTVFVEMPAGTSNATTLTLTGPYASASVTSMNWRAVAGVVMDNSVAQTTPGRVFIGPGTSTITCYKNTDSSVLWTNANTKRICFSLAYEIA